MTNLVKRSPFLGNIARSDTFSNLDDWFNNFWMPRPFLRILKLSPRSKLT